MKIAKSPLIFVFLSIVFALLGAILPALFVGDYAAWRQNWWSAIPIAFLALLTMFFLPLFLIKSVFKDNFGNYGLRRPEDLKKASLLSSAAILVLLPIVLFFGAEESFREYYSMGGLSPIHFFFTAIFASSVYYIAEEFLFRGFLFWGLWRGIKYHSFWVSALLFAFFHLTKPIPEVIFAFFAGLVFAYLSFKTKSFIPAAVVHFILALVLNVIIFFLSSTPSSGVGGVFRF
ncbi:MAG: CPBP family intramembrane metalloprotease [Candidatus Brennerbacteria bacterium]|nr:CPBP family intramembrane metalloprotease [Candidatus Brennerbacteria bacterium]